MSQKAHWSGSSADLTFACEKNGKRLANRLHRSCDAHRFTVLAELNPDLYCIPCARAARLALAKDSAPKPTPRPARSCSNCRSGAINPGHHGRTEDTDLDLCDVCYWRKRAPEPRPIGDAPLRDHGLQIGTDSERYAELRALVEAWQNNRSGIVPLLDWRHR